MFHSGVMSCVNSTSFVVLVNGSPTAFFKGSRGIRQGYPLSPYMFLLVIKGLGILLNNAKDEGLIKGIKVVGSISLSHTLFVDDVMIFGKGIYDEWLCIKGITDLFCTTSGMSFSPLKSCFRHWNVEDEVLSNISHLFHISSESLDIGIKYLGFYLKCNFYLRNY